MSWDDSHCEPSRVYLDWLFLVVIGQHEPNALLPVPGCSAAVNSQSLLQDPGQQFQLEPPFCVQSREEGALKQSTLGIVVLFQMTNIQYMSPPPKLKYMHSIIHRVQTKGADLLFCRLSQQTIHSIPQFQLGGGDDGDQQGVNYWETKLSTIWRFDLSPWLSSSVMLRYWCWRRYVLCSL